MMANRLIILEQFLNEKERLTRSYQHIPAVVEKLIAASWNSTVSGDHEASRSIPSQDSIVRIIHQARRILFPGYFTQT
ncbi:MAG: serine acetyltransferase, partial [Desulfobacterales bacterium]|nr:serine acetyltransferase [Desulfobacterales bacterium]